MNYRIIKSPRYEQYYVQYFISYKGWTFIKTITGKVCTFDTEEDARYAAEILLK